MEVSPISASLGAMGSLPRKLDELLATGVWALHGAVMDEIEELAADLDILYNLLLKLSNAQDPPSTARYWMNDVRELSYDVEDCADQFICANDRAMIHRAKIHRATFSRIIISRLKISRLPKRRKWRPWITDKVTEFRTRAQDGIQRYWRFKFDDHAFNAGYPLMRHELPTMLAEPGDLVGIEGPLNKLDRWLTNGEEQLKVVSIFGVGGIGKTTLAQKLWGKLQGQFECRAFVRTTQKPDMRGILRNVLLQVRPHQPPDPGDMHHLIRDLREYLQGKRYFVIIDDLWATSVWDVVSRAFPEGNCCSRIITTTEIMEVALACCGYCPKHIFKMEALSDDESEKLLLERIIVSGIQIPQQFDAILPQIVRSCGGLPLAIIIVARLLASYPEKLQQWGHTQNYFGSTLGTNRTVEGFIGGLLSISFNSLPYYLKTCLLYLSTYPEGFLFLKDDLVKQWVAEGFIHAKEQGDTEEVAGSYFDELVNTGLIQVMDINYNCKSSYSVHHMVLDFITYKSIEENFTTVLDYSQTTIPLPDTRRLSLHFGSSTYATTPASTRLSQVRSLFFFGLFNCIPSFVVFKLLRVLDLHFWGDLRNTSFDLTGISELFWLRYLQVTCNVTVKLPDHIEVMKQLETLDIKARVRAVPLGIVRLPKLLHLCVQGGVNLPSQIGCLRSLRTLKYFDLGSNSEDNIRGLGDLTNLRDLHLTYSTSSSSEHLKRNLMALTSSLGKLGNLKSLTLAPGTADMTVLFDGSSGLPFIPVYLQRLELLPPICIFSSLPKWIGQLRKICIMKVAVRELLTTDIDILTGLPSLTVLSLRVQTSPEGRIDFNDGAFPVLKYFKFRCGLLCMSFKSGTMPNLRRLKLGFNALIGEKYDNMLVGIEHLVNLQDISGQIGAATESDRMAAESAIKDAISKHPRCPSFNIKCMDLVEEDFPPEKQHPSQEPEEKNKHNNSRLSQLPDLPSIDASHRLKSGDPLPGIVEFQIVGDPLLGIEGFQIVGDPLPGIEGFQIVGDPRPGSTLRACGLPTNGTTLCNFQWVRCLDNFITQYIEGATSYDYVVTADDVGTVLAVECTPRDGNCRQGDLVREFANSGNKITCDPEMQNDINTYISRGRADFDIFVMRVLSLDEWEHATLVPRRTGYQINISHKNKVVIDEKYSPYLQTKIPNGRTTEFLLVSSGGVKLLFNTRGTTEPQNEDNDVRFRDLIVLVMRTFQNKLLNRHSEQRTVMKVDMRSEKARCKAINLVAETTGVHSAGIGGDTMDQLSVVGQDVDVIALVTLLRREVGYAEIVKTEEKMARVNEAESVPRVKEIASVPVFGEWDSGLPYLYANKNSEHARRRPR